MSTRQLQPFLHDLVTLVRAPVIALSRADGQIGTGADGCYLADRRVLSALEVRVGSTAPVPVDSVRLGAGSAQFLGVLRGLGDAGPDPTVFVERTRELGEHGLTETVTVRCDAVAAVEVDLEVRAACDLAELSVVKAGGSASSTAGTVDRTGWTWAGEDGTRVRLTASADADDVDASRGALRWRVRLHRGEQLGVVLRLEVADDPVPPVALSGPAGLAAGTLRVHGHGVWDAFLARSSEDIDALMLADVEEPDDCFVAAGAPWYLTLFGRDSLWAARMLLPTGTGVAAGTLRVLARRQGSRDDEATAEAPGKILHEVRAARGTGLALPPSYFGTVDATPLWVLLLHDAWRWGMPPEQVRALLPHAAAAMGWVRVAADRGGGVIAYRDESGYGLSNQGWKDSSDAIQFRDGRMAEAPIALCEVQAYAYAAATAYADLLDAFGGAEAVAWRAWAAELAKRFRAAYWIQDEQGRYPATALDAHGTPVDTVTSNIGHLLGTGLLDADEEALVVARLASPEMDSGFGLRTLSSESAGFNPLSYHAGSVWAHDTAIAVAGLSAVGSPEATAAAGSLLDGLIRAASIFDLRIPELYGGHARAARPAPPPYPAACRPQAWSAASAVSLVGSALGLQPDVPTGVVRIRPLRPWPFGRLRVEGIRIGSGRLEVGVDADGTVHVDGAPTGLRVEVC